MKYIIFWVIIGIGIIIFSYFFFYKKTDFKQLPFIMNKIDLSINNDEVFLPDAKIGTTKQSWEGDILKVTVLAKTYVCGLDWKADYTIDGDTIKITAIGSGYAMNCPELASNFNFSIPNLPKKDYKIVSDISYHFLGE
jgi:hypothetical protein